MKTKIVRTPDIIALLILLCSIGYAAEPLWPLKGAIDFSSGYGDYRKSRFHAGLDLRTGGVPGAQVFAPVDGYLSRVKISYTGYGKGLYLRGDDGCIYVFGHLQRFADSLDHLIKTEQMAGKRYYIEREFPTDSIRIKAGDLLAYSGQTGAGAPHLHFEKRTADNFPLNPIANGFKAKDKTPPAFTRVGFAMTDEKSLLETGRRQELFPVVNKGGSEYLFEPIVHFDRPFGLLVECSDRIRKDGPTLSVYRISVYLDDTLWYETTFDTLDYATGSSSNLEYVYQEVAQEKSYARRLYRAVGNDYRWSRGFHGGDGTIGTVPSISYGLHKVRIVATDPSGNKSTLRLSFMWVPESGVYALDSTVNVNDSNALYYFTPTVDAKPFGIDSARVFLNKRGKWGPVPTVAVTSAPNGGLIADARGFLLDRRAFRLSLYTKSGCRIDEQPFCGLDTNGTDRIGVSHEINDDGLYVTIKAGALRGAYSRVELYYQGNLLGIEYPSRYFTMEYHYFFIPPRPEYARVDEIRGILSNDLTRPAVRSDTVNLVVIGLEDAQVVPLDSTTGLTVRKSSLFAPRFIELKKAEIRNRPALKLNSDHYEILPETFALREPIDIQLTYTTTLADSGRTALYRLNKKENRWEWINDSRNGMTLTGKLNGGGSIAAVYDFEPPVISKLYPEVGETVRNLSPKIQFTLTDSLSGFLDDRNILIKLDGKWQIPEFDPETGLCTTQALEPLSVGSHHLSIEVSDRVGNKAARYLQFDVRPPAAPRTRK